MEKLICKTCASESMIPVEVQVEGDDLILDGGQQESYFYTCHVCGDNWLSIKETAGDGSCQITFIHQMGMSPLLKRVARVEDPYLAVEEAGSHWSYFMGDDEISEEVWREKLSRRRRILKSICTN
ncbi:MAG: hypothetical protein KatS3mg043_0322 [Rhodothermaceae bacterium]|nr:MAG: hypothetical protein KatS3mg043_0322 [Rhodothermaceae bacterium]